MVIEVTVAEAEARMDELLDAAIRGEEVVVTQDGVRRAKLTLVQPEDTEGVVERPGEAGARS